MSEKWQSMESAPRDGEVIDVWLIGSKSDIDFYCAVPMKIGKSLWAGRATDWQFMNNKFRPKLGRGLQMPVFIEPYFWMKRPEPPHYLNEERIS